MLRSLHMKLVLIMVLLVVCLMTIAGAFLTSSINQFYLNEFYSQMSGVFQDTELVRDLSVQTEGEEDGGLAMEQVLRAYMGALGVDGRNRNYFVLSGTDLRYLAGSDDEEGADLEVTPNLLIALNEKREGSESDPTAGYMDLAIPIHRGGQDYIIYILDSQNNLRQLNSEIFLLIIEALGFGLEWPRGILAMRSRWSPTTRSACSPTPSTTWRAN